MSTFVAKDGAEIFYKDWGEGQPIVFSHGWPLCGDAWDAQMLFFGQNGFRVIAHDRRGHGRSAQTWNGNTMDTFADDLAQLIEKLNLNKVVLVGHSMGGGEVVRYIGRHGNARVAKLVLLGAVPPMLMKTASNPTGAPPETFDGIRAGVASDRSQFWRDVAMPFYGFNRPGAKISEGLRESFWLHGMQASVKSVYDCIKQFSETDFTADLGKIDVPTLVAHGDDDQMVPLAMSSKRTAEMVRNATLKVDGGGSHGFAQTNAAQFNQDLLSFIKTGKVG